MIFSVDWLEEICRVEFYLTYTRSTDSVTAMLYSIQVGKRLVGVLETSSVWRLCRNE